MYYSIFVVSSTIYKYSKKEIDIIFTMEINVAAFNIWNPNFGNEYKFQDKIVIRFCTFKANTK